MESREQSCGFVSGGKQHPTIEAVPLREFQQALNLRLALFARPGQIPPDVAGVTRQLDAGRRSYPDRYALPA